MKKIFVTVLIASVMTGAMAQTENPRGIYKMMTLTGKQGEIMAPFDQYKICTDSVTLMLVMQNGGSQDKNSISLNDKVRPVKWLTNEIVAVEVRDDYHVDWQILERVTDNESLMSRIASRMLDITR